MKIGEGWRELEDRATLAWLAAEPYVEEKNRWGLGSCPKAGCST